jgi:hypothetical protein
MKLNSQESLIDLEYCCEDDGRSGFKIAECASADDAAAADGKRSRPSSCLGSLRLACCRICLVSLVIEEQ